MDIAIREVAEYLGRGAVDVRFFTDICRESAVGFKRHPLGFFYCVPIDEGEKKLRVHVWPQSEGLLQDNSLSIHNHSFDFTAWILKGKVRNIVYKESNAGDEYVVYRTKYHDERSILESSGRQVRIAVCQDTVYGKGCSYSLRSDAYHRTLRVDGFSAMTVLLTTSTERAEPFVLGPIDSGEPQYSFMRSDVPLIELEPLLHDLESRAG